MRKNMDWLQSLDFDGFANSLDLNTPEPESSAPAISTSKVSANQTPIIPSTQQHPLHDRHLTSLPLIALPVHLPVPCTTCGTEGPAAKKVLKCNLCGTDSHLVCIQSELPDMYDFDDLRIDKELFCCPHCIYIANGRWDQLM